MHCSYLCPPAMVPFLTYCYAAGVFDSEEVEELATHDSNVSALMHAPKWPTSAMIRSFRKSHWALLKQSLTEVLARARSCSLPLDSRATAELSWRMATPLAEAEERLQLALCLDANSMDE
jgi:hypothetical protein